MPQTATLTLTDFLLARIEEEETAAFVSEWMDLALTAEQNARVYRELEAKRRLVEDEHFDGRDGDYIAPFCQTCSEDERLVNLPCPTLRILAAVYADHPDYRDEWRA